MRIVRTRLTLVGGAIALAISVGAAGIFASNGADRAFAQITGNSNEVEGIVEALPASGVFGTWQVAGRTVTVTEATEIDLEGQTLAVGIRVEVEGVAQADGSLAASEIEVDEPDRDDDDDGGSNSTGGGVLQADDDD
jgi:hypothetical protein